MKRRTILGSVVSEAARASVWTQEIATTTKQSDELHGYLGAGDVRASDAERRRVLTHLTVARADGRRTAEQYHARCEAAVNTTAQRALGEIARDLPPLPYKERDHRITVAADAVTEMHNEHPNIFFATTLFLSLLCIVLVSVIPMELMGGWTRLWETMWGIIPFLGYFVFGLIGVGGSIVGWICD